MRVPPFTHAIIYMQVKPSHLPTSQKSRYAKAYLLLNIFSSSHLQDFHIILPHPFSLLAGLSKSRSLYPFL